MNILKRSIFALAIMITGIISANAQSYNYNNKAVMYGIKGGMNLAKLKGVDGKIRNGFTAGVFAEYAMTDNFAIRTETNFSTQGVKVKEGDYSIKLNYINMPVLAKYYPTDGISVELGPQLGVLLSGKGGPLTKKSYKTLDFGIGFGLGFSLGEGVELGARYTLGLTDITKTPGSVKNSVLNFTLAIGF